MKTFMLFCAVLLVFVVVRVEQTFSAPSDAPQFELFYKEKLHTGAGEVSIMRGPKGSCFVVLYYTRGDHLAMAPTNADVCQEAK